MGQTVRTKYQTDAGTVVQIRVSPSTAAVATNTPPAGAVDDDKIYAYASNPGSSRGGQLNARGLILERFLGTGLGRKRLTTFVPILTQTAHAAFVVNAAMTINTVDYTIARKVSEA